MKVNKDNIEKIFDKCKLDNEKEDLVYSLYYNERKNKTINNEIIPDEYAIRMAMKKIKFHLDMFDAENYSKSVLLVKNSYLKTLEKVIRELGDNYKDERRISLIKDCITYVEMSLNLDITFYTSLLNLYECSLEKKNITMTDIKNRYNGRR